jgi:hypothetical protein
MGSYGGRTKNSRVATGSNGSQPRDSERRVEKALWKAMRPVSPSGHWAAHPQAPLVPRPCESDQLDHRHNVLTPKTTSPVVG